MNNVTTRFLHTVLAELVRPPTTFDQLTRFIKILNQQDAYDLHADLMAMLEPKALVKAAPADWEYVPKVANGTNESPSVRRLEVPGGWLYQIAYHDELGKWQPPTFVPRPADVPVVGRWDKSPELVKQRDPQFPSRTGPAGGSGY